jgi:hypothetical protein
MDKYLRGLENVYTIMYNNIHECTRFFGLNQVLVASTNLDWAEKGGRY